MTKLLSFAPILLATRSKYVLEDSKCMKKVLMKKMSEKCWHNFFVSYVIILRIQKNHQNRSNRNYFRELHPLKPHSSRGAFPTLPPLHPLPTPDTCGLNLPSQLVIGYHWLAFLNKVCRVADAVVKVPNSLRILSTKLTISQKLKITHCPKHT